MSKGLDYVTLMLNSLRKQGYTFPHIVLFADGSGRVSKGPVVGGLNNIMFTFQDIEGIATDHLKWQWKWDMRDG